jgi:hypothetical protein
MNTSSQDSHSSRTRRFGVVPGLGTYASQTTVQRRPDLSMTTERSPSLGEKGKRIHPESPAVGPNGFYPACVFLHQSCWVRFRSFLVPCPASGRYTWLMPHLQSLWKMGVDPECQKSTPTKTRRTHPTRSTL